MIWCLLIVDMRDRNGPQAPLWTSVGCGESWSQHCCEISWAHCNKQSPDLSFIVFAAPQCKPNLMGDPRALAVQAAALPGAPSLSKGWEIPSAGQPRFISGACIDVCRDGACPLSQEIDQSGMKTRRMGFPSHSNTSLPTEEGHQPD